MFEFLITVLWCDEPGNPASCEPYGQKTAIYRSYDDCGKDQWRQWEEIIAVNMKEEGGFSEEEIEYAKQRTAFACRILRRAQTV